MTDTMKVLMVVLILIVSYYFLLGRTGNAKETGTETENPQTEHHATAVPIDEAPAIAGQVTMNQTTSKGKIVLDLTHLVSYYLSLSAPRPTVFVSLASEGKHLEIGLDGGLRSTGKYVHGVGTTILRVKGFELNLSDVQHFAKLHDIRTTVTLRVDDSVGSVHLPVTPLP